ncbi:MAG: PadR family transcriptional regulator [Solirubrobacterales bacterium]|nr:PadR family transcriptional regulator [Solirubrobacterales bacterium]
MAPRALRNPLSLVVLGLLAEQPLHPYAMRTLMRERGHERTVRASGASLYDAVARLERSGLIEVHSSSRDGGRPERTTYRITKAGQTELQVWVREGLTDLSNPQRFVAALSFMFVLAQQEVVALLEERTNAVSELIRSTEEGLGQALDARVSEIFLSEERYAQALRRAERDWLVEFTQQLRDRTLRWPDRSARKTAG